MINLVTNTQKMQLVTGSAVVNIDVHASYADYDGSATVLPGSTNSQIATATTTDIVAAPSSGYRNIKEINIRNSHASSSNQVTVQLTNGTTTWTLFGYTLLAGEHLVFTEGNGWQVLDATGSLKTSAIGGTLLKVTHVTASGAGSWTPDSRCKTALVECVAAGGQGGGAATSSSTSSVGGGGGGGAYAASRLTGAAIKVTSFSVGAKGSGAAAGAAGNAGADTTWDTTVIVAKAGSGGGVLAAGSTLAVQAGGAGGVGSSCTGDVKVSGGQGEKGVRLSGTQGWSGDGGEAGRVGSVAASGVVTATGGTAGVAAAAGAYGAGGSGAATLTTSAAGGAGMDGMIAIYEYA